MSVDATSGIRFVGGAYLRCFDVVVEVVSECLDMRYSFLSSLGCEMPREQNYSMSAATPQNIISYTHQK